MVHGLFHDKLNRQHGLSEAELECLVSVAVRICSHMFVLEIGIGCVLRSEPYDVSA